jgi:hypothetical protein
MRVGRKARRPSSPRPEGRRRRLEGRRQVLPPRIESNGDFADGIIIAEGQMLGGETFLSFDRKALKLAKSLGCEASAP